MLNHILLKKYFHEKSNDLIFIRMFLSIAIAILTIVPALFLKSYGFSDSTIGFIMSGIALFSLIISILSTILLEEINEYKLFLFGIFIPLITLILLVFFPSIYLYLVFLIISTIFLTIRNTSSSIILKDITTSKEFTKKESLLYSFMNIGWFIGPFIGGLLLANYGFTELFLVAAVFYAISFLIALLMKLKLKTKKRKKIDFNLINNIKNYFSKPKLIKPYLIAFSTAFWYSMVLVYVPLFMIDANLNELWIGIFISLIGLPLIFFQLKLNWFIKKFGTKKLVMFSFFYLSLISLALAFYSNIYFSIILLITTPVALSFLEPLREIYLFKNIRNIDEEKIYPIFHTSFSVGGIIGKFLFAGILLILPKNFIYLLIFLWMLFMLYTSTKLKNYTN